MFKRLFWFTSGAGLGFGGAMWVRRRVRRAVARYAPERVTSEVTTNVRQVGTDLREALCEGREAMQTREAELRRELAPGKRLRSLG
ncbi:MAG: hypothetical protein ACRD2C_27390 [Acidimicrobiales bacterium]